MSQKSKKNSTNNTGLPKEERKPKTTAADPRLKRAEELYLSGRPQEALPIFRELAQAGNARAMYCLYDLYHDDRILRTDDARQDDTDWLKAASDLGDPMARARMMVEEEIDPEDFDPADVVRELEELSASRDVYAQAALGQLYLLGIGVPERTDKAISLIKEAARAGDCQAQVHLGELFADGMTVYPDYKKAVHWHTLAAEQASSLAAHSLGRLYLEEGRLQDFEKAVYWLRKAVEWGEYTRCRRTRSMVRERYRCGTELGRGREAVLCGQ